MAKDRLGLGIENDSLPIYHVFRRWTAVID
jgi:hypothetical protein